MKTLAITAGIAFGAATGLLGYELSLTFSELLWNNCLEDMFKGLVRECVR